MGRPIAYRGDPNAPELTDLERRRIKRRIANRESARRVRHKRQEELEDMQIKAICSYTIAGPIKDLPGCLSPTESKQAGLGLSNTYEQP